MIDKRPRSKTKEEFPKLEDLYADVAKRKGKKRYGIRKPKTPKP